MKKITLALLLFVMLVATACSSGQKSETNNRDREVEERDTDKEEREENDEQKQDQGIDEGNLSVEILGDQEATFIFSCDSLLESFNGVNKKEALESGSVYEWGVEFGDFLVKAYIPYMDIQDDYSVKDLRCSICFVQRFEDESTCTWEIKSLNYEIVENTLKINVVLPNEEEMTMLEGIDIKALAKVAFSQIEEYIFVERDLGRELYTLVYDSKDITNDSIVESSTVFPQEVYDQGYISASKDVDFFAPPTDYFVLYDGTKTSPDNGLKLVDRKILLVLDEGGEIIDGYTRIGCYIGFESSSEGLVETVADQQYMDNFAKDYMQKGYKMGTDSDFQKGSFSIDDFYFYLHWKQEMIDQANTDAIYRGYLSAAEWIQDQPEDVLLSLEVAEFGDQYKMMFMGNLSMGNAVQRVENYCQPEDFAYLQYIPYSSEDYYIVEYEKSADLYCFDESGLSTESFNIQVFDDQSDYLYALNNGFMKVEGSTNLLYTKYEDTRIPKKDILKGFIFSLTSSPATSYEQSLNDYAYNIYMSKPWLSE